MKADAILMAVNSVTKDWTKKRKKEERSRRRPARQYYYSDRVNFTDIAAEILPGAYKHGSGDGKFTLGKRNFYYAARDQFNEAAGREITYSHFKTILLQFMNSHRSLTASWKITADPRGTFSIPNTSTDCSIPVGTIKIDDYLNTVNENDVSLDCSLPIQWPSKAPGQRYAAVLYIEKEGFGPMMDEARIAERFDLAIISCKGQSVVAARKLVDHVCKSNGGLPLFVVHDFDKAGFEICNSLTSVSELADEQNRVPYRFKNSINVVDFGLRLDDAMKYELASESVAFKGSRPSGITDDEFEFLKSDRRIELNAFTAPEFIAWIESKLTEHLPERLLPDPNVLEQAYRRAYAVAKINAAIVEVKHEAIEESEALDIPKSLIDDVKAEMERTGEPWDVALHELALEESEQ